MMKNEKMVMEYKAFVSMEDKIDMILSSMGIEHIEIPENNYVTFMFEVETSKEGYMIKEHLNVLC